MISTHVMYGGEVVLEFDTKKHRYSAWSNLSGLRFPVDSVTWALGIIDKSGAMTQWAANQCVERLKETIVPGKSYDEIELDAAFHDARFNFRRSRRQASSVGTLAHRWIQGFLKARADGSGVPEKPVNAQALECCNAAEKWIEEHAFCPSEAEKVVYSRRYRYAGTLDACGRAYGVPAIVDWKTSNAIYPEYRLQLAAYACALMEMNQAPLLELEVDRWIVRLGKDDGSLEPVRYTADSMVSDFHLFLHALELRRGMEELKRAKLEFSPAPGPFLDRPATVKEDVACPF